MNIFFKSITLAAFFTLSLFIFPETEVKPVFQFYKGQTHCHTIHSDGDQHPRQAARWYKDHEYNFLFITDHDKLTPTQHLDDDPNDDFIVIPGEEVTESFNKKPLHICGLNIKEEIFPRHGTDVVSTLQNSINAIRAVGGIPQINHPNWRWAFNDHEIAQLKNVSLFELYNMTNDSNNFSAGGKPGMEEIWDRLLSKGYKIYGVMSDDTHDFSGEFSPRMANPGQGWVMVRAEKLTPEAIVGALEKGDFYGSKGVGVYLTDLEVTSREYRLSIRPVSDYAYTTHFIGKDGKILQETHRTDAVYTFKGDELYVRAKVYCSSGDFAILQPVFLRDFKFITK